MAQIQVKTTSAEQTWQSPDGKITLFAVTVEYDGQSVEAKTYSKNIAVVGWSGTVETYQKDSKNGSPETFIKLPPKEDGGYQGGGGGGKSSYVPKDEAGIKAMWAISQSITLNFDRATIDGNGAYLGDDTVEGVAKTLFAMVDRVKTGEAKQEDSNLDVVHQVEDNPMPEDFLKDIDKTFGTTAKAKGGDTPWTPNQTGQLPV